MTSAPAKLLEARALLLRHLDIHPGVTVDADLDPAEVGIVGDPSHIGGYHCGIDRVRRVDGVIRDYSVNESSRDKAGLDEYASALDVGKFTIVVDGQTHTLRTFSTWLVDQCERGTADTRDIREVIYSPDGATVRRWDRLGIRTTGDLSHTGHTHISVFRDADGSTIVALMRRYLNEIGLDMEQTDTLKYYAPKNVGNALADVLRLRDWFVSAPSSSPPPGAPPPGSVGAILLEGAQREPVAPAPVDVAALAAVLLPLLRGEMEAASEAAVRKVLGKLDEPPDG